VARSPASSARSQRRTTIIDEAGLLAPKRDYRRFDFGIITDRGRDRKRSGGGF
jgi:hypothetical protein